jgi:ribosomal protection tetracycline resistance protein
VHTLNLGILAHVDAGKTTLTERLLYDAGVIDEIGSVDDGNTQTDTLELERQRGITIKSAVVSFAVDGVTVNLIDTPGHPDFIAEVERAMSVLDGVVLVVSAVEGVQAQTRVLMRALQRLRMPTLIFVNKIDRVGARPQQVLRDLEDKLSPAVIAMGATAGLETGAAAVSAFGPADSAFAASLVDLLADHDDAFLSAYVVDDSTFSYQRLLDILAEQSRLAVAHPVFFGSAITGAGVDLLRQGLVRLLPAAQREADGPVSGSVFKVDRGPAGERVAYVRVFSGTIRVRDQLRIGEKRDAKVTAIRVFEDGRSPRRSCVEAGQIAMIWGLGSVRIGDVVGVRSLVNIGDHQFAPPTLESVVVPGLVSQRAPLHVALTELAEQDPLINLRQDESRHETSVSLYGEVQKEVIQATLADQFGVDVTFRETTTICIERLTGIGAAEDAIKGGDNPFLATVGLRVEPAPIGSGIQFGLEVELGAMPLAFFKAVEETVHETLREGLCGWQVPDCAVFMTRSGYWPRQSRMHGTFDKSMSSTAGDFRHLTPLVVMSALKRAGTSVHEPMHRYRLEIPADAMTKVLQVLARLQSAPLAMAVRGRVQLLEGVIAAAQVHQLQTELPGLTQGEGVLESEFDGYQPVRGPAPTRPRTDNDPLDRKKYLLTVTRQSLLDGSVVAR